MDASFITPEAVSAFFQILFIDIVLAGDNAIVVGAMAAGLPAPQRKKVILIGVLAALVLRIAFALLVTQLLQIVGLVLAVAALAFVRRGHPRLGRPAGLLLLAAFVCYQWLLYD